MLLSVIIPVYNVDLYLEECIQSLIEQDSLDDEVEYIFVNDGSTDKSGVILEKYEKIDKRIKVVYQENMGVAEARRKGVKKAIGEYISWVDPDDIVSKDWFITIKKSLEKKPQILLFDYYRLISGKYHKREIGARQGWMDINQIRLPELYGLRIGGQFWFKVFLRSLYNTLTIPNMKYAEDLAVWHQCLLKVERVYYVKKSIYIYRYRGDSLVALASYTDYMKSYQETLGYFESLKKVGCDVPKELYDNELVKLLTANVTDPCLYSGDMKNVLLVNVFKNPYIPIINKMKFILRSAHILNVVYIIVNRLKR